MAHDESTARKSFTDVVVGFALQLERESVRGERAEALTRRASEAERDGVVWQPFVSVALCDFPGECRTDCTVRVGDRKGCFDAIAFLQRRPRDFQQNSVERFLSCGWPRCTFHIVTD